MGEAPHNGGSCQLSLSYDDGASFKVIKSMIGNCPIQTEYSFTIPSTAPAAKNVLFAWTWFNYSGNREMYMNCARVDITGTSGGELTGPEIFKGNILGDTCVVPEGIDIVFPNLGPDVVYGKADLKGTAATILDGCQTASGGESSGSVPATEDAPVLDAPVDEAVGGDDEVAAPALSSSSVIPAPASSAVAPVSSAAPIEAAPISSAAPIEAAPAPSAPAVSSPATLITSKVATPTEAPTPADPSTPGSCIDGAILCAADGVSWSVCNNGSYTPMGTVAAGTTCRSETFKFAETDPLGLCDDLADGKTKCTKEGKGWAVCVGGTWIDMGLVSAGQSCNDGKITKRSVRHRHRRAHGSHA